MTLALKSPLCPPRDSASPRVVPNVPLSANTVWSYKLLKKLFTYSSNFVIICHIIFEFHIRPSKRGGGAFLPESVNFGQQLLTLWCQNLSGIMAPNSGVHPSEVE